MNESIFIKDKVKLKNPVLIEGLPGIGLVGKLAADHMIKELNAPKLAEMYSPHFPPQVIMMKKGICRMLKHKFYYWKNPDKKGRDLILLVGDIQVSSAESQFQVCQEILDLFESHGGKTIYTLGGYGTGRMTDKPKVFGSATHMRLVKKHAKTKIEFGGAKGSIIGAAGMLLGLGKLRGMEGICIMGETHGGYVDAKAAQEVLKTLSVLLSIEIDLSKLEKRAKQSEKFVKRLEKEAKQQSQLSPLSQQGGELSYIR